MQPKLRLFSDGKRTYAEICGKSIGKGISSLSYSHDAPNDAKLKLEIDLEDFEFMEDGYFDKAEKKFMEYEPPKVDGHERLK